MTSRADDTDRPLVECRNCEGTGTVQRLVSDPDADEPTGSFDDLKAVDGDCDRCDGRGEEFDAPGCPRCGASSEALSSSLRPSGSYNQSCTECPWSEVVG
ncbi:hypothetical protein [Natronorubrum daqingense]|uniref:Uncharacterized protein n=1 Tax=Natronorubrum daqingense TaxID=588898 RepID=A0A1N7G2I4_9EURY|nr:hypothetical protein [Natronorubrum daqingense]APX98659.1 hypothetical protein BB347_18385 [Natronorubrum daqingense]SIS06792.1 hypothetical protein SAMN05421809_3695 [Natronorubrum daqingense]